MVRTSSVRRVVVSSNCQTGSIAAGLRAIFPDDKITPVPLHNISGADAVARLAETLQSSDVWVSIGDNNLLKSYDLGTHLEIIKIPIIRFAGFHPDIVHAKVISTGARTEPHYNSAIAVWAYKNRLDVVSAERLFNKDTFAALGYLDAWATSAQKLKKNFEESELDYAEFMLSVQREGVFMHTFNHPKPIALARLAKLIARKLGAGPEVLDRSLDLVDGLNQNIWPLYPEIGASLSLPSNYVWKIDDIWVSGLHNYLERTYENFVRNNIDPGDIVATNINESFYDDVLGRQAGIHR